MPMQRLAPADRTDKGGRAVTVDPTALQTARLAIATITLTWPMLAAAADTTLTRRAPASGVRWEPATRCHTHQDEDEAPPPSCRRCAEASRSHDRWESDLAQRDAQLRAEREDRDRAERFWALPSTRPPADLDILDVRGHVLKALHTSLLLARSDLGPWLGKRGLAITAQPPNAVTPHTIGAAVGWLQAVLDHTAGAPAAITAELAPAVRRVHQVLDLDPDEHWRSLGTARCPACRQRALYRWTASTDRRAWTRECRALITDGERTKPCTCRGASCPCARPGARNGSRHLWPA